MLVVITEAIGARREPCEQRLEVSSHESLGERPALLAFLEQRRFDGRLRDRRGADLGVSRDHVRNGDVGGQEGFERQAKRFRNRIGLNGVEDMMAVFDL